MKVHFIPKTKLGKWSIGCIIGLVVCFVLFLLLVESGQRGGDTFFSNLLLTIPMFLAGISGVAAFLTGIIGIIKSKERSVFVFLATTIGLFVLWWILGEIIFPH